MPAAALVLCHREDDFRTGRFAGIVCHLQAVHIEEPSTQPLLGTVLEHIEYRLARHGGKRDVIVEGQHLFDFLHRDRTSFDSSANAAAVLKCDRGTVFSAALRQSVADFIQFEWFDDSFDFFHS